MNASLIDSLRVAYSNSRRPSTIECIQALKLTGIRNGVDPLPDDLQAEVDAINADLAGHGTRLGELKAQQAELAEAFSSVDGESDPAELSEQLLASLQRVKRAGLELAVEAVAINHRAGEIMPRVVTGREESLERHEQSTVDVRAEVTEQLEQAGSGLSSMPAFSVNPPAAEAQFEHRLRQNHEVHTEQLALDSARRSLEQAKEDQRRFYVAVEQGRDVLRLMAEQLANE